MRRLAILAFSAFGFAAGCGVDSTAPRSIAGEYALISVNGAPLPFTFFETAQEKDEFLVGLVTLNSDNTYVDHTLVRYTVDSVSTDQNVDGDGTYTLHGNIVTFSVAAGDPYTMLVADSTLTQQAGDLIFLYKLRAP